MTEAVIIYQSIDLLRKSMDWFLYDNGLCHERVNSDYFNDVDFPVSITLKIFENFSKIWTKVLTQIFLDN